MVAIFPNFLEGFLPMETRQFEFQAFIRFWLQDYLFINYKQYQITLIENSRMSHKFGQPQGLQLDSRIRDNPQNITNNSSRASKQVNSHGHHLGASSPMHKKVGEHKIYTDESSSEQSYFHNSVPGSLGRVSSFEAISVKAVTELGKAKEEKDILKRNFNHELEYYIRERMKDLVIVQELLTAKQYQRLHKYVDTQLSLLRKKHDKILMDDECWKPLLTKDTFMKSAIEDDASFKQLINNLILNLSQHEKTPNYIPQQLRQLSTETDLSVRKLASYFQQSPFDVKSLSMSSSLSVKLISEQGLKNGKQIIEAVAKAVQQNSKGKYNLAGLVSSEESAAKSQLSKLIEQNSISKIRSKKISF